jgi:hypothetical protein
VDLNRYIENNIDSLTIIGDSTNTVYELKYKNTEYILKKCKMNENNPSTFWQYMKYVFGHDFHDQIINLEILFKKLSNEFIPIAKPVFIDPLLQYHVYEKIEGINYSPDMFPENINIHSQLGRFIGYQHQFVYKNYGTIYCQNKNSFENDIYGFSKNVIEKYWTDRNDVKYYFNGIFQDKVPFDNYSLIMPDISANQFIFSGDMDRTNGVIDLDAYIVGPRELELTIIELCIPNNECADYFKKGYEIFNKLPLLRKYRKIFRFVSYLCDLDNTENMEDFLTRNIYYD